MTVAPHILRRYVIERALGRTPRVEWAFYASDLGAWIRCDEMAAKRHEHHRRIRKDGLPWCEVLGHRTDVRDDEALQVFFLTLALGDWSQLAAAVREHPKRCLRDWSAAGARIIAAVSRVTGVIAHEMAGPLAGWPASRGTGQRSMLPR
ncbi:hypothetical protein [Bradyrhizobium sp. SZCCHNRI2007]|uniref:hypothetical protein n=1 Tax=Bradyrhizobium sp. SZCCHNRI2007 TaxID=3057281 RepID=UPI0028E544A2|nr:hypothetical protein [Bradyrhizobium sp. SZCCHNRI2007]